MASKPLLQISGRSIRALAPALDGRLFVLRFEYRLCGAALDVFGQPYPGLGQGQPEHLVLIVFGQSRHGDAFFGVAAMVDRRPHDTPRVDLTTDRISIDDCGAGGIRVGRNSGEHRKNQGDWNQPNVAPPQAPRLRSHA